MKKIRVNKNVITGIVSIAIVITLIIVGICLAKYLTRSYLYVDMNDTNGKSYNCYYDENSRDLRCMIPVKVQQYTEESK